MPLEEWPAADRAVWERMVTPVDILDDAGPLAHWSQETKRKCIASYGHWLSYLRFREQLPAAGTSITRIQPDLLQDYLSFLQRHLSPVTVFMRVVDLLSVAQAAAPDRDWEWLRRIRRRLEACLAPVRNKQARIVPSRALFELGQQLMETAPMMTHISPRPAAVQYRDGLLIALLASRPLRMKNMAQIEIGRHLTRTEDSYWLTFEAYETKNHRPIHVDVPRALNDAMDVYLECHRPTLQGERQSDRLWLSIRGSNVTKDSLACNIRRRTAKHFGFVVNAHLFRDCAATSLAIDDPEHVRAAAALLCHKSLSTTTRHYDQSRMLGASRNQQAQISELRDRLRRDERENMG